MCNTNENSFSTGDNVLMHARWDVVPVILQKRLLKEFLIGHPELSRMEPWHCSASASMQRVFLAAKEAKTKWQLWLKTDIPWSMLPIDYSGLLKGSYQLVVIDSFSKWPELHKCRKLTSAVTVIYTNRSSDVIYLVQLCLVMERNLPETSSENFVRCSFSNISPPRRIIQSQMDKRSVLMILSRGFWKRWTMK